MQGGHVYFLHLVFGSLLLVSAFRAQRCERSHIRILLGDLRLVPLLLVVGVLAAGWEDSLLLHLYDFVQEFLRLQHRLLVIWQLQHVFALGLVELMVPVRIVECLGRLSAVELRPERRMRSLVQRVGVRIYIWNWSRRTRHFHVDLLYKETIPLEVWRSIDFGISDSAGEVVLETGHEIVGHWFSISSDWQAEFIPEGLVVGTDRRPECLELASLDFHRVPLIVPGRCCPLDLRWVRQPELGVVHVLGSMPVAQSRLEIKGLVDSLGVEAGLRRLLGVLLFLLALRCDSGQAQALCRRICKHSGFLTLLERQCLMELQALHKVDLLRGV